MLSKDNGCECMYQCVTKLNFNELLGRCESSGKSEGPHNDQGNNWTE